MSLRGEICRFCYNALSNTLVELDEAHYGILEGYQQGQNLPGARENGFFGLHREILKRITNERKDIEMKKIMAVMFVMSVLFPMTANATYRLKLLYVQSRVFENSTRANTIGFECRDVNNKYPLTDVVGTAVLTDPSGKTIKLNPVFSGYMETDVTYDAANGQWKWDAPYHYANYTAVITDQLITGTYHLKLTDKDGEISEEKLEFGRVVDLPVIPARSYRLHINPAGDLVWEWQVPDNIPPTIQSSARAWIDYFDEKQKLIGKIWVTLPTHVAYLPIPRSTLEQISQVGKTFEFGTHIRANDNYNRSYSTSIMQYGTNLLK